MPLVAVILKPFSHWLPVNFQYLGLYCLLSLVLQGVFSYKLCRRFISNELLAALGSCFFVLMPAFIMRFVGHFDLVAHWIMLAVLWIYFSPEETKSGFSRQLACGLLLFIAGGISPYISLMCLLIAASAAVRDMISIHQLQLTRLLAWGIVPVAMLVSWIIFGFVEVGKKSHDYVGGGYRESSMNLLAPFDPHFEWYPAVHSILFKNLSAFTSQYEGYNYLGAGVILLILGMLLFRRAVYKEFARPVFAPLWAMTILSFILAISARVTLGRMILVDVPLPHPVEMALGTFRSSGRFFWPGAYFILLFFIQFAANNLPLRAAVCTLSAMLCLQIADTRSLHAFVLKLLEPNAPGAFVFKDPYWETLGSRFDKIVVLPAWQTLPHDPSLPGGPENWYQFGLLAARQGMATNTCYLARTRSVDLEAQNETLPNQVRSGRLDADTVYVLSPYYLAGFIGQKFTHINCRSVDGMFVFWKDEASSDTNPAKLTAALDTALAMGVDFREVSAGFAFATPARIPYSPASGFELNESKGISTEGPRSEIQIFHPGGMAGGSIVLDIEPCLGGTITEQDFAVFLVSIPLGNFSLKERGKVAIPIPSDAFKDMPEVPQALPLTFEWKNAATEKQLGTGADYTPAARSAPPLNPV